MHVCEFCFGPLEVFYDYEAIKDVISHERIASGPPTMWRYADLLPCDPERVVDIGTGFTPLIRAGNLARKLGLKHLYLKNDCQNPSWSFKDRVVSVAGSVAKNFEFDTLACASTGNLANSVSAHAARAGMKAIVFIPANLEQGKVIGSAIYSPTLVAVDGSYDDVNRLCSELGDRYPWAFVNINIRPYYAEGSKTLAYEVCEQLGWRAPDRCVVPLASGSLFTKIYKGLKEMAWLELVDWRATRMNGAQALGCSPIVEAWERGTLDVRPQRPDTIAKSLAIGNPADGYNALKVMSETGGGCTAVTDPEVIEGMKLLAETEGIFAETAGGVVISGLRRMVESGEIDPDEVVVAFITGAGLKTQEVVAPELDPALSITPSLAAFEEALLEREGALPAGRNG
jgi:threonine synthase